MDGFSPDLSVHTPSAAPLAVLDVASFRTDCHGHSAPQHVDKPWLGSSVHTVHVLQLSPERVPTLSLEYLPDSLSSLELSYSEK